MNETKITNQITHPKPEPGSGGNVVFRPGCKYHGDKTGFAVDGSIIFQMADQSEAFRIDPDGQVVVRGNVVGDDVAMYETFKRWLEHAELVSGGSDG